VADKRLVQSVIVPGKVDHFRALMQRLIIQYTQKWVSSDGTELLFSEDRQESNGQDITPPTRGTWSIIAFAEGSSWAGIEAYELSNGNQTQIDFFDGYTPNHPALNQPVGSAFEEFCGLIIDEMQQTYSRQNSTGQGVGKRRGGRPGLDREELIYRLAKAQEAEEIRREDPSMRWKEIAREVQWRPGTTKAGIKLLEDARQRLRRLQRDDPDNLLEEVARFRGKEKKET
jgi:hypothetical protein